MVELGVDFLDLVELLIENKFKIEFKDQDILDYIEEGWNKD
jgi:hypothetical protein